MTYKKFDLCSVLEMGEQIVDSVKNSCILTSSEVFCYHQLPHFILHTYTFKQWTRITTQQLTQNQEKTESGVNIVIIV